MQEFIEPLQIAWENWATGCEAWMSHLESTYGRRQRSDTQMVNETIKNMRVEIGYTRSKLQQANPITEKEGLFLVYAVRYCLDKTEANHQKLCDSSAGDSDAERYMNSVIEARKTLDEKLEEIDSKFNVLSPAGTRPVTPSGLPDYELFWLLGQANDKVLYLTEKLLKGPLVDQNDQVSLTKLTAGKLIEAWQTAIDNLTDQINRTLVAGTPQEVAMASSLLVFVHRQLQEILFNNLNATIIPQESAIP